MTRPTVRTATLTPETVALLQEVFGSAANAFKNLGVVHLVTYPVFARAWHGGTVQPAVVRAIESGWGAWSRRIIHRLETGEFDAVKEA